MRRNEIRTLSKTDRRAFTLIELLVVIFIIATLMALSAAAVLKYIGSQQVANTRSTLDKTQSQLNKVWGKVKDQANHETMPAATEAWILKYLAGNDANALARTRIIYVKLKMRQAFPMNFNEALFPPTLPLPAGACPKMPPLPTYKTYLNSLGIINSSGASYESSACLLMALQRGVSGAGIDPSDLTKGGATGSVTTPSGGMLTYLTDAWGQPLFFTRVPTGNLSLNPNPNGWPGANDPGDPQGYLQMAAWGTTYGPSFHAVTLQQLAKGNNSYKLAPMLCSAGMDKTLYTNPVTFAPQMPPGDGTYGDDLFSNP